MWTRAAVMAAAFLCVLPANSQVRLDADPKLQTRVTLRDKIVSLKDFAREISADTKAKVEVSRNLVDLKITAICRNRPASEILSEVASLFEFQWQRDGDAYVLVYSAELAAQERDFVDAELRLRRSKVEASIRNWMEDSKQSLDSLRDESDQLEAELQKSAGDATQVARRAQMGKRLSRLNSYQSGSEEYDAGFMFRSLDAAGWDRFWQGEPLVDSSKPTPGAVTTLPTVPSPHWPADMPKEFRWDPPATRTFEIRYLPFFGTLQRQSRDLNAKGEETFLAPLAKGLLPPNVAFFMQDAGNGAPTSLNGYDEVQRPPEEQNRRPPVTAENSQPRIQRRISFLFGTSTKAAAAYGFSLVPRHD